MSDAATAFRAELIKIMPGYKWTVHHRQVTGRLVATGTRSSGMNRLSTLCVIRADKDGKASYEVMSAGFGRRAEWLRSFMGPTLAKALRGLQDLYEREAATFGRHASALQVGRSAEPNGLAFMLDERNPALIDTGTLVSVAAQRGLAVIPLGQLRMLDVYRISPRPSAEHPGLKERIEDTLLETMGLNLRPMVAFSVAPEDDLVEKGMGRKYPLGAERHSAQVVVLSMADYLKAKSHINDEIMRMYFDSEISND